MTYDELLQWSKNPLSHKASLTREPIERNLKLLKKANWDDLDEWNAKRTIAFINRMKHVRGGRPVNKHTTLSKRDISLRNWAYNDRQDEPL